MQGSTPDGSPFTAGDDPENQLKIVLSTDSSGVVRKTEYTYTGDGLVGEIKKYANTTLTSDIRLMRDGLLDVQERDGTNTVTREYTWGLNLGGGIGGLLNLKQDGQDYSYVYDGNGNVAAVLDASQAIVAAYRYDPFGKLLVKTGALTQPFGFSTKRYDPQTGLIYYGFRFYGPEIGRWTTRDPLGEAGGLNLYAFVGNNPVNWVDPYGLELKYPETPEEREYILRHLARLKKKSPTASRLIKMLDTPGIAVNIKVGLRGSYDRETDTVSYMRCEGVILMNTLEDPTDTAAPINFPWKIIPPEIVLGHELIHAYHDVVQGLDRSREIEQKATIGLNAGWWYGDFSADQFTENRIRSDYGIDFRPE